MENFAFQLVKMVNHGKPQPKVKFENLTVVYMSIIFLQHESLNSSTWMMFRTSERWSFRTGILVGGWRHVVSKRRLKKERDAMVKYIGETGDIYDQLSQVQNCMHDVIQVALFQAACCKK